MEPAPTQTCSSLRLWEPCSHPQLVHDWHLASPPDAEGRPVVVRQTHKDWSLYVTCKSRPSRAGCVLASAGYLLWRYLRHNRQLTPKGSPGSHNVQHKCEETTANNGNNMTTLCKKMLEFCASKNIQKFTFSRCRPHKEHADICASFSSEMQPQVRCFKRETSGLRTWNSADICTPSPERTRPESGRISGE